MSRLTERIALVTGASRGIGAAIARRFAAEGAAVALHGRDVAALRAVQDAIRDAGGHAMTVTGDVTALAQIEQMRTEVERQLGAVDVLVANAGASLTPPQLLEDIDVAGWRASLETNLTATFLTLKAFLPGMKARRRGAVITLSSAAARRPHPRSPLPYAAAKAGIQMLSQHVAAQVGPFGIRVNCIAPETILTERNQQQIPLDVQRQLTEQHPIAASARRRMWRQRQCFWRRTNRPGSRA